MAVKLRSRPTRRHGVLAGGLRPLSGAFSGSYVATDRFLTLAGDLPRIRSTLGQDIPAGVIPADPDISVTGSLVDGGTIIVRDARARFGTKPNGALPLYYYPFETNLLPHPTLSRAGAPARTLKPQVTYQTIVKPPNSIGAAQDAVTLSLGQQLFSSNPVWSFQAANGCYIYAKRRYGHQAPLNLKSFRVWRAGTTGYPNGYHTYDRMFIEGPSGAVNNRPDQQYYYEGNAWQRDTWGTEEFEWLQASAPGVYDGIFHYWKNGKLAHPYTTRWQTRQDAGSTGDIVAGYLDQYSNDTIDGQPLFYSTVYMDDSRCRTFVSAEPSFNTATFDGAYGTSGSSYKREIAIPVGWQPDELRAVLRLGEFSSFAGKNFYIVTSSGTPLKLLTFT